MNNKKHRLLAGLLLAAMCVPMAASAAAPQATADETVYVNLDYYGSMKDMRIVKGVNLNGQDTFTDYGNYAAVYNMSTRDKPKLGAGSVTWALDADTAPRFYYECTPANPDAMQMPWTFDVSYKLNGRDATAEECAGKDAMVETIIHCIPNEKADLYYQNNMLLMVVAAIDQSEGDTLDAPGAQVQSFGTYKAAVFMAVPGEEQTFTYQIGSTCFESKGAYMMMMPATMSQVDKVQDVREMKDKVSDAHDDLYVGISSLLSLVGGMQSGIATMSSGISGLDAVRQSLTASRDSILDPDVDATLAALDDLAGRTDSTIPELLNTQATLTEAQGIISELLQNVGDMKTDLTTLQGNLHDVSDILDDTQSMIDAMQQTRDTTNYSISELGSALFRVEKSSGDLSDDLENLNTTLSRTGTIVGQAMPIPGIDEAFEDAASMCSTAGELMKQVKLLMNNMQGLTSLLDKLDKTAKQYDTLPDDAITVLKQTLMTVHESINTIKTTLTTVETFQPVVDQVTQDSTILLSKVVDTLTFTKTLLTQSYQTMSDLQATLRQQRAAADTNTSEAIDGLLDVLQHTMDSSGTSADLQTATDSIHSAISDEFDELEDDTNVLNIDNSLSLQSFTSSENITPSSLQFILRTDEISVQELEEAEQQEPATEDIGPWQRIVEVFRKIFSAISSVFAEE